MRILIPALLLSASLWCQTLSKETKFLVKLGVPVDSRISRAGDKIVAAVISPERFLAGRLEGAVEQVERARLRFSFQTLRFRDRTISIASVVTGVVNSKGQAGLDDEDRVVRIEAGAVVVAGPGVVLDEGAEIKLSVREK